MNDGPISGAEHDAFAQEASRMLAFLSSPPPTPSGLPVVVRGQSRVFDPAVRAAAERASIPPIEAQSAPALAAITDLDLGSLTTDQLMMVMGQCVAQMTQRLAAMSAEARSHI